MMAEHSQIFSPEQTKDYQSMSPAKTSAKEENTPKRKVPRRVLHCSDGVYEEYSTDEEEIEQQRKELEQQNQWKMIDPKSLAWIPWMIHYTWLSGSTILSYCDSFGEKLAWFFGITSPKYYYELEEFKKMQEEEAERKKQEAENTAGWVEKGQSDPIESDQKPSISTLDPSALKEVPIVYAKSEDEISCDDVKLDFDPESQKN